MRRWETQSPSAVVFTAAGSTPLATDPAASGSRTGISAGLRPGNRVNKDLDHQRPRHGRLPHGVGYGDISDRSVGAGSRCPLAVRGRFLALPPLLGGQSLCHRDGIGRQGGRARSRGFIHGDGNALNQACAPDVLPGGYFGIFARAVRTLSRACRIFSMEVAKEKRRLPSPSLPKAVPARQATPPSSSR